MLELSTIRYAKYQRQVKHCWLFKIVKNRPIAVVAGGFNNGFIYTVEIWDFTKRKEGANWIQGMKS